MNYTTWWFEVIDKDSDLCGEQFFVEVGDCDNPLSVAFDIAVENFGDVVLKCWGRVSSFQAELMGLDTY